MNQDLRNYFLRKGDEIRNNYKDAERKEDEIKLAQAHKDVSHIKESITAFRSGTKTTVITESEIIFDAGLHSIGDNVLDQVKEIFKSHGLEIEMMLTPSNVGVPAGSKSYNIKIRMKTSNPDPQLNQNFLQNRFSRNIEPFSAKKPVLRGNVEPFIEGKSSDDEYEKLNGNELKGVVYGHVNEGNIK
jgi:hypothetical protein